jgi:hypothetical protein
MERRSFTLKDRKTRHDVALLVNGLPLGTRIEIKDRSRTDDQNRAIHGLVGQILKQRPEHRGIVMDLTSYKAVFMHALGRELTMLPSLDGKSMVPIGLSTSALTVSEFNDLMTFVLAWAAQEGLTIKHFDGDQGAGGVSSPARAAA